MAEQQTYSLIPRLSDEEAAIVDKTKRILGSNPGATSASINEKLRVQATRLEGGGTSTLIIVSPEATAVLPNSEASSET